MSAIASERSTGDLLCLLNHASDVLSREVTAVLHELGISERTFCVLAHALPGPKTQSQLAEECLLDKTTMVVTLDRLERDGLARRESCPNDRRARIVTLTEEGQRLVEDGQKKVNEIYAEMLGRLPVRVRHGLLDGLTELAGAHAAPGHS